MDDEDDEDNDVDLSQNATPTPVVSTYENIKPKPTPTPVRTSSTPIPSSLRTEIQFEEPSEVESIPVDAPLEPPPEPVLQPVEPVSLPDSSTSNPIIVVAEQTDNPVATPESSTELPPPLVHEISNIPDLPPSVVEASTVAERSLPSPKPSSPQPTPLIGAQLLENIPPMHVVEVQERPQTPPPVEPGPFSPPKEPAHEVAPPKLQEPVEEHITNLVSTEDALQVSEELPMESEVLSALGASTVDVSASSEVEHKSTEPVSDLMPEAHEILNPDKKDTVVTGDAPP